MTGEDSSKASPWSCVQTRSGLWQLPCTCSQLPDLVHLWDLQFPCSHPYLMLPSGSDFLLATSKPKALACPVPQLHLMMLSLDSSLCPQICHLPPLHRQLLWDADAPKPCPHTQSKSCSGLRADEFRKSSQVGSTCHLPEGPLPGLGSLWTGFVFPLGSEPHSSRPRNPYCGYKAPHALTCLPRLLAPPEPLIHHALLPPTLQPPLPYP